MTLIPAVLRPGSDPLEMKRDFENKLIAADTDNDSMDDIFYKFDALGRRVGRDDGTANVVYFQDGQQTIAAYPSGTVTYTYVYASYIEEPVMRGGSDGLRYYHRNQQYSITALTDGGGSIVERYAYTAYGQVTILDSSLSPLASSNSGNRYTYTGREWNEGLSLYHYRARMHDAVAGRYCSRDPIGYQGSEWNLYELVSSSPLSRLDPSGMISVFGYEPPVELRPLSPIPWNPCIIAACGSCGAMLAATVYFASEGCSDVNCVITNLEVAYSMMPRITKTTIGVCVTGCGAVGCSLAPRGRIQTGCLIGVALMGGIIATS
jgi:RHS repeat-associated protein